MPRANAKQEDSNILSAEAYMGQCPGRCEACYVNFGQTGVAACNVIANGQSDEAAKARERARAYGWDGEGCLIWKKPNWIWSEHGPRLVRLKKTGYVIPCILRVSTLGDSSLSKGQWCQDIIDLWEDNCFFNSTIRVIKANKRNLRDVFHKVVVTVNGGFQEPYIMPPPPPGYTKWPTNLETAQHFVKAAKGSMEPLQPKHRFASFDAPRKLSDVGLEDYESKVKFYRLRSLPTIEPRFETDLPVVHTLMKFRSISNLCEFARRYGLELRYEGNDAFQREVVRLFGYDAQYIPGGRNRFFLKAPDAKWNVSPRKNEETEMLVARGKGSIWRHRSADDVAHLPWVCDARKLGCKACGLCATLDATEENNTSPIMEQHGFVPVPYSRTYVEVPKQPLKKNPEVGGEDVGSLSEDFFGDILDEVFYRENPSYDYMTIVQEQDWIEDALRELAGYLLKLEYYVEGWNTSDEAGVLLSYCFWALLFKAKRLGMSKPEAWAWCRQVSLDATGLDLFETSPELMLAWDGDGWMVEIFGPLEE